MRIAIIDDEILCTQLLENYIRKYFPNISIVLVSNEAQDGLKKIVELSPDLIILDIEMPRMNGFQLLDKLGFSYNYQVIFTTAYDKYAIKAFKYGAVDYLLKPIDRTELITAIEKVALSKNYYSDNQNKILSTITKGEESTIIALSNSDGITFSEIDDIIRCESSGNYTTFYLSGNEKVFTSKLIKDVEKLLVSHHFMRVHQSHLVNLKNIRKYTRSDGGELIMSNGDVVPISRQKKQALLEYFEKLL